MGGRPADARRTRGRGRGLALGRREKGLGARASVSRPSTLLPSGDLFAVCPVAHGSRQTSVERSLDSSRAFAVRLVDAATKRAVVVGLSFADRAEAFDFSVALADHEASVERGRQASSSAAGAGAAATAGSSAAPAAPPPPNLDLSLKPGQSITVPIKKTTGSGGVPGGLLSRAGAVAAPVPGGGLLPPPPPPAAAADPFAPPPPSDAGGGAGGGWATFD